MMVFLVYMALPIFLRWSFSILRQRPIEISEKSKNAYLNIFGILMAMMIGLRSPAIGSGDTIVYCQFWDKMRLVSFSQLGTFLKATDFEYGFQLAVWLLTRFFDHSQWFLVLTGAFFAFSICRFVKKNCRNVAVSLMVFNCLGLFNFMVQGMRQAIAMCICLYAIEFCKKNRTMAFFMTVALACTFHASAIVFLSLYFISKLELNVKNILAFSICAMLGIRLLPQIFGVINTIINDDYALATGSDEGGWIATLIAVAIALFGVVFRDRQNKHFDMFVYMVLVGAICMLLRQSVSAIAERVSFYFAFAQCVVASNSLRTISNKRVGLLAGMAISILCFFVAVHKASYSSLVPYRFFFQ